MTYWATKNEITKIQFLLAFVKNKTDTLKTHLCDVKEKDLSGVRGKKQRKRLHSTLKLFSKQCAE